MSSVRGELGNEREGEAVRLGALKLEGRERITGWKDRLRLKDLLGACESSARPLDP